MAPFRGGHRDVEGDEAIVDWSRTVTPAVRSLRNDLQGPGGGARRGGLTIRGQSRSLT